MALSKFANGIHSLELPNRSTSIDKPESPAEDSKNIMSIFDGGFYFPKPENSDDRYIATCLSPNTAAYASLHASGQVKLHPMQSDQASLISTVLAQKFTISLKKNVTFDDLFLVVEQYLNEGM
jgi:Mediator complex subunit 16